MNSKAEIPAVITPTVKSISVLWRCSGAGSNLLYRNGDYIIYPGKRHTEKGGGDVMQQLSENYTLINRIKKAGIYIVLILISLLVLLPLVFLLLNSFKSQAEIIRNPLSLLLQIVNISHSSL